MKKVVSLILLFQFLVGCATPPIDHSQEKEIGIAIQNNNLEQLKSLMERQKIEDVTVYSCLIQATINNVEKDKNCRGEILSYLSGKGGMYSEAHQIHMYKKSTLDELSGAPTRSCKRDKNITALIENNCKEAALEAISKVPSIEVASSMNKLYSSADNLPTAIRQDPIFVDAAQTRIDAECSNSSPTSAECQAAKELSVTMKKHLSYIAEKKAKEERALDRQKVAEYQQAERDKEQAYLDSPLGQACEAIEQIKMADKWIAHEKKVGAASGFVNKETLHGMGQTKVFAQETLAKMKKQIRQSTGKDFNPKDCRKIKET